MDRSLAGRLGMGSFTRQPARARAGAAGRPPKGRRTSSARRETSFDRTLARLAALPAPAFAFAGRSIALVWRRRRARIALIVALIATPLLAGGWLWLRGSSLVAVRHVRVSGVHGTQAHAIEAALSSAAHGMTTLEVNSGALHSAVAAYPLVSALKISTSFPHGMSIRVIEQPAVAALSVAGAKTAVAADGVVLGPSLASASLPAVSGASLPATGQHVREAALRGTLAALGAAPAPLFKLVTRVYSSSKGLTLAMHSGLLVYFGDGTRPHAKWQSLARVLADSSSAGASYVDVRVPERPAAGFSGGVAPATTAETEASGSTTAGAAESSESLTEKLSTAAGGGSATAAPTGSAQAEAEENGEAETSSAPSGETPSSATAEAEG
jgi:cell division protein FtsQ